MQFSDSFCFQSSFSKYNNYTDCKAYIQVHTPIVGATFCSCNCQEASLGVLGSVGRLVALAPCSASQVRPMYLKVTDERDGIGSGLPFSTGSYSKTPPVS